MKKGIKISICIFILLNIISLNIFAKVKISVDNTVTEIYNYYSENNGDLSGVSKEILEAWYRTIISDSNGGRSAPFKAAIAEAAKKAGVDTETIYNNKDESSLNYWTPTTGNNDKLTGMAGKILGIIQVFGSVVSVLALVIIGIKYMLGSVEEKAKYKETMLPYIVGCIILFAITNIVTVLYKIGRGL